MRSDLNKGMLGRVRDHRLVHPGPFWHICPIFTNHCYNSSSYQHHRRDPWHRDKWKSTLERTISPKVCIRQVLQHLSLPKEHCKWVLSTSHHQKCNFSILNVYLNVYGYLVRSKSVEWLIFMIHLTWVIETYLCNK